MFLYFVWQDRSEMRVFYLHVGQKNPLWPGPTWKGKEVGVIPLSFETTLRKKVCTFHNHLGTEESNFCDLLGERER